ARPLFLRHAVQHGHGERYVALMVAQSQVVAGDVIGRPAKGRAQGGFQPGMGAGQGFEGEHPARWWISARMMGC
ncbi:MAG: hypothetical protein ACKPAC_13630, partial [Alphaproteobacteria bacterium]